MGVDVNKLMAINGTAKDQIGWLFWFSTSEAIVEKNVMERSFLQSGLPEKYKIPDIRPVDAYRRASKTIENEVELDENAKAIGEHIALLCRDVAKDRDEVVRHIVIERRVSQDRRLNYDRNAATLTFYHGTKTIGTSIQSYEDFVVDAVRQFEQNYQLFQHSYDGQAKRRVIRDVLYDMQGEPVKDSVYVVLRSNGQLLNQLMQFIRGLPDCKCHAMPVENTEEARDMVRDVITEKVTNTMNELRHNLKGQNLSDKEVKKLLEQAKRVKEQVVLYQNELKETIGSFEMDIELLQMQMMSLIEHF